MKRTVKYRRCSCLCRCKINNLMKEKISTPIFFIFHGPPALVTSFSLPGPLLFVFYPALVFAQSLFLPYSTLTSASQKFLTASDFSLLAKLRQMRIWPHFFKLKSHCPIIVFGLTEHILTPLFGIGIKSYI